MFWYNIKTKKSQEKIVQRIPRLDDGLMCFAKFNCVATILIYATMSYVDPVKKKLLTKISYNG